MKTISLKLDDSIFGETEKILQRIKMTRNRYINEALHYFNRVQHRQILEEKLRIESGLVRNNSLNTLKDFERIDYDD